MILTTLVAIVVYPILAMFIGIVGYFIGVIVAWVPWVNDLFINGLPIEHNAIPTIMAWVFVLVFFAAAFIKAAD